MTDGSTQKCSPRSTCIMILQASQRGLQWKIPGHRQTNASQNLAIRNEGEITTPAYTSGQLWMDQFDCTFLILRYIIQRLIHCITINVMKLMACIF